MSLASEKQSISLLRFSKIHLWHILLCQCILISPRDCKITILLYTKWLIVSFWSSICNGSTTTEWAHFIVHFIISKGKNLNVLKIHKLYLCYPLSINWSLQIWNNQNFSADRMPFSNGIEINACIKTNYDQIFPS